MQMTDAHAPSLRWCGNVDLVAIDHFRDRFIIAVADPEIRTLVIDVTGVGFIDFPACTFSSRPTIAAEQNWST